MLPEYNTVWAQQPLAELPINVSARLSEPPFASDSALQELPFNSALNCDVQNGENADSPGVQQRLWSSIKHTACDQPDLGHS